MTSPSYSLAYNPTRRPKSRCGHLSSRVKAADYYCIHNLCRPNVDRSNPKAVVIYYILLAAIGAVSGVFAYYPHPGGQA